MLSDNSPNAVPIAGGTDLLVRMKRDMVRPGLLVDISKIEELHGVELTDEGLMIGSMVTHAEIKASELVRRHTPAVAAASASVGSDQTRNLGTIGGNLVSCVPSLDSAPPLLVLDALVTVADAEGRRRVPLETFFVAPRCSLLTPKELLVSILIPREKVVEFSEIRTTQCPDPVSCQRGRLRGGGPDIRLFSAHAIGPGGCGADTDPGTKGRNVPGGEEGFPGDHRGGRQDCRR